MTISSSPGLEGYISFRALYSQVMGKINWLNEQKWVPIAPVQQKDLEPLNPRVVIPWNRNPIFIELTREFYPELMWY